MFCCMQDLHSLMGPFFFFYICLCIHQDDISQNKGCLFIRRFWTKKKCLTFCLKAFQSKIIMKVIWWHSDGLYWGRSECVNNDAEACHLLPVEVTDIAIQAESKLATSHYEILSLIQIWDCKRNRQIFLCSSMYLLVWVVSVSVFISLFIWKYLIIQNNSKLMQMKFALWKAIEIRIITEHQLL